MLIDKKYSMLIPTFNRPLLLSALLEHLSRNKASFPIFILDSSNEENKRKNASISNRYKLNVRHMEFEENARFDFKIAKALHEVCTDYVSLCADDDIVFVEAIESCINELDRQDELTACHGIYLNFSTSHSVVDIKIEYASQSIDMDDVISRACNLLLNYEALNYAVYRRESMLRIINAVSEMPETMFWELFSALAALVIGKVRRIPHVYYARRGNNSPGRTNFHPAKWIAEDPDAFAKAFVEYRDRLFSYFDSNACNIGESGRKVLTQAHIIYMCRSMDNGNAIMHALGGTLSPLLKCSPREESASLLVGTNQSFVQRHTAPNSWLRRKMREKIDNSNVVFFNDRKFGTRFTAPRNVRKMLSNELIEDISKYILAADDL